MGLYTPPDPTYGRYLLPLTDAEQELLDDPTIRVSRRRVFIAPTGETAHSEIVHFTPEELHNPKEQKWLVYQVWEKEENGGAPAEGCDLVMLHGVNDYGGRWAYHVHRLLEYGFRIIVPDHPSHGRSTGVHVFIESSVDLTDAVFRVLADVKRWSSRTPKKTFLVGSSMGGWVCLSYCNRWSSPTFTPIDGIFLMAPMIGVAPESYPGPLTRSVARALHSFAGRLPLAPAVRGNTSSDPRVEVEHYADVRCYHGNLRISTGLALLEGLLTTPFFATNFKTPIRIIHGSHDRVTTHEDSLAFISRIASTDKECEIYHGYEHTMLWVGEDEKDDIPRQKVLRDLEEWVMNRV
jgi:acylglycerol lipase